MIEITKTEDIKAIKSAKIRIYLKRRLGEVGYRLNPQTEGSFIFIEDPLELQQSHKLQGVTLPSVEQGFFTQIESVFVYLDIIEISLLFNNEYMLSVVLSKNRCSEDFLQQIGLGAFNEE